MPTPEELARQQIDTLLEQCRWIIQNYKQLDHADLGRQAMAAEMKGRGTRVLSPSNLKSSKSYAYAE